MSKETLLSEALSFRPLTMNEWGDFELLFNGLPACQMFWGTCKRYHCCVETHQLEHCGGCDEFPCHWLDWNPEEMDEATFAVVRQTSIANLQRRKEVGTVTGLEEHG